MGGKVPGARRISPAPQSEPARIRSTDGVAKGRETCVEPTYTFSCPPQEGGYSASEAREELIQGRRRNPNGGPSRRADFHARGLATRAVLENGS